MNHIVSPQVIHFGIFEADLRAGELHKSGLRIHLQDQPFQVLAILLEHAGDVVMRDELRAAIWPADTFVDFDNSLNTAVNKIREALGDSAENPRFVETVPRRGYRFIAPVDEKESNSAAALTVRELPAVEAIPVAGGVSRPRFKQWAIAVGSAVAFVLIAAGVWFYATRPPALGERDQILLADFQNNTGEPIFDDGLKTALAVKLEESPYLSTVSDVRVQDELELMTKPPGTKVLGDVARELCQRANVKALLNSSIAHAGSGYLVTLEALNCRNGEVLARRQELAGSRDRVLDSLSQATTGLRKGLGESLKSVRKFDTPLEQATTPSLEALRAFTEGMSLPADRRSAERLPFYQRAVALDPNFAFAWYRMARVYSSMGDLPHFEECIRRAFNLRERASERERYIIGAFYSQTHSGWSQAIAIWQTYARSYPRDSNAHYGLAVMYGTFGWWEEAHAEARECLRLAPENRGCYFVLGGSALALNRFDEAKAAFLQQQALDKERADVRLYAYLYAIAALQGDTAAMARSADETRGKKAEVEIVQMQAIVLAYHGRFREARKQMNRALLLLRLRPHFTNTAPDLSAIALEVNLGNLAAARARIANRPADRHSIGSVMLLAQIGDLKAAEAMLDKFLKEEPDNVNYRLRWAPLIRARIALKRDDPAGAIEALKPGEPYENWSYAAAEMRGEAYLRAGDAAGAAKQFKFIVDHPGILPPGSARAYVHLGRAYAQSGDTAKARKAYEDFFAIWKDADPDIPILRQAKAEYAKLK